VTVISNRPIAIRRAMSRLICWQKPPSSRRRQCAMDGDFQVTLHVQDQIGHVSDSSVSMNCLILRMIHDFAFSGLIACSKSSVNAPVEFVHVLTGVKRFLYPGENLMRG
jgi:hypothetical protein